MSKKWSHFREKELNIKSLKGKQKKFIDLYLYNFFLKISIQVKKKKTFPEKKAIKTIFFYLVTLPLHIHKVMLLINCANHLSSFLLNWPSIWNPVINETDIKEWIGIWDIPDIPGIPEMLQKSWVSKIDNDE